MSETQRCDGCGARNPAEAGWCTQCYEPLATTSAEPVHAVTAGPSLAAGPTSPPPVARPMLPSTDGLLPLPPGAEPAAVAPPAGDPVGAETVGPTPVTAGDGRFRSVGDDLEWRCEVCEEWNVLDRTSCTVCNAPFLASEEESEPPRQVDPALLLGATVLLPGAGHALLAQWSQAFFRALLALVWGLGGVSLLRDALASGQPVLPAVPMLVGWLVVVATSANDVLVAGGNGGTVLLRGRLLLGLVVGVISGTVAGAFLGAFDAIGG